MRKPIRVITKKKRGRPVTTGKGTLIGVRLLDPPLAVLDEWISRQGDPHLSRPEAIRRLVEIGLEHSKPIGRRSANSVDRAKQLAAKAIDGLVDPAAPAEETANRKRRLLKGPEEFREVRHDQLNG
jgi:hypothetical protein